MHTLPQGRQSGFKVGGVVVPGLKTGGVFGTKKLKQMEAYSTGFRVSSTEVSLKYIKNSISEKSPLLGTCSQLILLYILQNLKRSSCHTQISQDWPLPLRTYPSFPNSYPLTPPVHLSCLLQCISDSPYPISPSTRRLCQDCHPPSPPLFSTCSTLPYLQSNGPPHHLHTPTTTTTLTITF